MLSRMVVNTYQQFIEVSLWLFLILFAVGGWYFPNPFNGEQGFVLGVFIGVLLWVAIAVVFFGSFLMLLEIQKSVKKIESSKQAKNK